VRVVSTCHTPWAVAGDEAMRATRTWRWRVVDYRRETAPLVYARAGIRGRVAVAAVKRLGVDRVSFAFGVNAYSRVHSELVHAVLEEPADLFYGGTTGALAATAEASARTGIPFGLDLEDFHSEEQEGPDGPMMNQLAARIEARVLPRAAFLTTSSEAIAAEYERRYGLTPRTVNNTFPLPPHAPDIAHVGESPLKAYWFSQTIGAHRGFEHFIAGAGAADIPMEIHLRGHSVPGYVDNLRRMASSVAPRLSIMTHDPAPPDQMVSLCSDYDIGLALEDGAILSRELSLSNKALTYILAGLAVAMTNTQGQLALARELGEGALVFGRSDLHSLAEGLRLWYREPARLLAARRAAWSAAVRHWHWEHPSQRGALVQAVEGALA
jgi:hypothetical protein